MNKKFLRTEMILGTDAMKKLANARVAVFGIGGVGGYVVEALARSGIGSIDIIDSDVVAESNMNRQIIATTKTVGMYKVDAAEERILDINPNCKVTKHQVFYLPETEKHFDFSQYDYIVDAIDTVTGKLSLIMKAKESDIPVISAMGAGNKLDPTAFEVADISKTTVCPLAKVMRRELKRRGIQHVKVVYSKEKTLEPFAVENEDAEDGNRRLTPGSISFVPSVAGLILAGEVIKDLIAG